MKENKKFARLEDKMRHASDNCPFTVTGITDEEVRIYGDWSGGTNPIKSNGWVNWEDVEFWNKPFLSHNDLISLLEEKEFVKGGNNYFEKNKFRFEIGSSDFDVKVFDVSKIMTAPDSDPKNPCWIGHKLRYSFDKPFSRSMFYAICKEHNL